MVAAKGTFASYSCFHALTTNELHAAHDVLLHLDELRKLLGQVWAEGTGSRTTDAVACCENFVSDDFEISDSQSCKRNSLMFPLPKRRLPLVEEEGGGGFWICDAVGARDWRMEY